MRKKLELFDSQKDQWYYQPKIYINPRSADPLYYDTVEFRSSLSRDMSKKFLENLDSMLEEEGESKNGKTKRRRNNNSGLGKALNNNHKLRKPVISFFSDKANVLASEIEKINEDIESRKGIHKESTTEIQKDAKEVQRLLHDISLYSPGASHSIEMRRMDLEREFLSLNRELRLSKLGLWKDLGFLRRELREILFEYQALRRMAELVENGGKNGMAG